MLAVILVLAVPPLLVLGAALDAHVGGLIVWGLVVAMVPFMQAGWRGAAGTSLLLVLMAPVAIVAGGVPVAGAALMAVACILTGISAGWGLNRGSAMLPLAMAFLMVNPASLNGQPVDRTDGAYLGSVMLILALTSAWVIVALHALTKRIKLPKPTKNTMDDTLQYTVMFTVLVSAGTYFVLSRAPQSNAVWLVLTLIVVIQVGDASTWQRTWSRVFGTVIGALVAALLGQFVGSRTLLVIVAMVCLVGTLVYAGNQDKYWLYAGLLTVVVIIMSSPTQVTEVSEQRVGYTVLGAALAIGGIALTRLVRALMQRYDIVIRQPRISVTTDPSSG